MLSAKGTARTRPEKRMGLPSFKNREKATVPGIANKMEHRKAEVSGVGSGKYCGLFRL